jgi:hypothetical protein
MAGAREATAFASEGRTGKTKGDRIASVHGVVSEAIQRMLEVLPIEEFRWEVFFPISGTW